VVTAEYQAGPCKLHLHEALCMPTSIPHACSRVEFMSIMVTCAYLRSSKLCCKSLGNCELSSNWSNFTPASVQLVQL
jgi:hypothetical protein